MNQLELLGRVEPPPETDDEGWAVLAWVNGRTYRWRLLHHLIPEGWTDEKDQHLEVYRPPSFAFQLEIRVEGSWRQVRYFDRQVEIWEHVRALPGVLT